MGVARRYGARIVLQARREHGRTATLALVGILVVSACSAFAGEPLAIAPPRNRSAGQSPTSVERPTPRRERVMAATAAPQRPEGPEPSAELEPTAEVEVEVLRLRPRPAPGPFAMDLFRPGDFMHQQTKEWCVAGSTQTMMNIIRRGAPDRAAVSQSRLYFKGRSLSPDKRRLGPIGVDLIGWANLLNSGGFGPYIVDGADSRRIAIRKAARALRLTGRPVGLVTWRGAHSWVMSGFTATADPAYREDFEVTAVNIEDTWYPWVSTVWGASRPPDTLVPVAALAEDYLPYQRPRARYPERDGRFMLILPTLPPHTVAR
jgi:hypothetical protein